MVPDDVVCKNRALADTSALVSLAVPAADETYGAGRGPDPLEYVLTACDVSVPPPVVTELEEIAQYTDIHAAAPTSSRRECTTPSLTRIGVRLANAIEADGFLTDEFGGNNFALVHAALTGPRTVPTPRLLCDFARDGHVSAEEARELIRTISPHRSRGDSPYVTQLFDRLD